jgi:hypothetical protein
MSKKTLHERSTVILPQIEKSKGGKFVSSMRTTQRDISQPRPQPFSRNDNVLMSKSSRRFHAPKLSINKLIPIVTNIDVKKKRTWSKDE